MRLLPVCCLASAVCVLCCPASSSAQKPSPAPPIGITRQLHPWARFDKGAWRYARVITESFDEHGAVANTSITEAKTTLEDVSHTAVTLRVEAVVEIAGKERDAEPKTVKQGLYGQSEGESLALRDLGEAPVTVEGLVIPCKVLQVVLTGPTTKTTSKLYYSQSFPPYILKQESTTTDLEGTTTLNKNTLNVLSLERFRELFRQWRRVAHVETVSTHPKGSIVTRALTSVGVPGGVICHTSEERDASGRLVRRSTFQLLAYGLDPNTDQSGWIRRVPRRGLKGHRFSPR